MKNRLQKSLDEIPLNPYYNPEIGTWVETKDVLVIVVKLGTFLKLKKYLHSGIIV